VQFPPREKNGSIVWTVMVKKTKNMLFQSLRKNQNNLRRARESLPATYTTTASNLQLLEYLSDNGSDAYHSERNSF
jgi:hypothetical protein